MPDNFSSRNVSAPPVAAGAQLETIEAIKSDLLMVYRAVVALEKRVNESTVNMVEIKPQLIALKAHTESLPNALREIRRSQGATQKSVSEFEARLRSLEARVQGGSATSAV
jgi:chromosome segregation ATPase